MFILLYCFRGSYGEITIEMPKTLLVSKISVEHIRPDTARSAPRHFVIYVSIFISYLSKENIVSCKSEGHQPSN